MWAKKYVLQYQCHCRYTLGIPHHLIWQKRYHEPSCLDLFKGYAAPTNTTNILLHTLLGTTHEAHEVPNLQEVYEKEIKSQNLEPFLSPSGLITHIYYTESDQLLQIESTSLRNSILRSLNMSVHIIGRRREKLGNSDPTKPFTPMYSTRHVCGNVSELYVLDTDQDHYIRRAT